MVNYCAFLGLFLSLVTTALIIAGAVLPHFVDVFIVEDPSDPDGTDAIAGVGVFSSEYDSSVVDPTTLAKAGAPDDKFTTPTLNFPLLFPGQENFVAEVLPITEAETADLEAFDANLTNKLKEKLDPVRDNTFTDCESYIPTALTRVQQYFTFVDTEVFPKVVTAVNAGVAAVITSNIRQGLVGALGSVGLVYEGVLEGTLAATQANCGVAFDKTTTINEAVAGCLAAVIQGGVVPTLTNPNIQAATSAYGGFFGNCIGQTVGECHNSIEFTPATSNLLSAALGFEDATNNFCNIIGDTDICDPTGTVDAYLRGFLDELYTEFAAQNADLIPIVQVLKLHDGYATGAPAIGASAAYSLDRPAELMALDVTVFGFTFPTTSTENVGQCQSLLFLQAVGSNDLGEAYAAGGGFCTLGEFFNNSLFVLAGIDGAEEAVSTMAGVAQLFNGCFETFTNVDDCAGAFAFTFLNGAYNGDIGEENFVSAEVFQAAGISECKDDVTDHDKIEGAQKAMISSFVFYGLGVVMGGANVAVGTNNAVLLSLSGLAAIFAGVLTIGALLIVQSAPVYEGVGEEAQPFEAFFQEGSVVQIAISAAIMSVIGGGCYLVGACLGCKATADADVEEKEEKEEKAPKEEAEAKKEVDVEVAEVPEASAVAVSEKDL